MRKLQTLARSAILAAALAVAQTAAADIDLDVMHRQTGGIFATGGLNNDPAFQNYFVGYGTSPGVGRTAERRSFFIFDLPALPSGFELVGARLELKLPFGGLIFGLGPGMPGVDPIVPDAVESFRLGLLAVSSSIVTSPTLTAPEGMLLFAFMDDSPVAAPFEFVFATPLPGGPGGTPATIPILLSPTGVAEVASRMGSEVVFSGSMPSWSGILRPDPSPPPLYLEASELIFGLTDVHTDAALAPKLVLTLAPVPAPPAAWLMLAGLIALAARARVTPLRPR